MTLDFTTPSETVSLVNTVQPNLYPACIPCKHNQLRHHISTRDADIVYYASQHDIYALHLSTQKRQLIKSLKWAPECLDAGHGWICAGGSDKGHCAFICIQEDHQRRRPPQRNAEVDDLLPLDLDPESRALAHRDSDWLESSDGGADKYDLRYYELGNQIVNSVTIHLQRSDQKVFEDEVVAVITNNDQTVHIFSLTHSIPIQTIEFPTSMNHATISPDGGLLIAVGDQPRAFFCRRVSLPGVTVIRGKSTPNYEWHNFAELPLTSCSPRDACFSTAFSPSGHICAVASQSGVTTIFDTSMITEDAGPDEAVIGVLRSSRPSIEPHHTGAVRSMSFSPAPWDMLAWAEDKGRVCVVDLRNTFGAKQTLELSIESSNFMAVDTEILESTMARRQLELERRFPESHMDTPEARDHLAAVNQTADYMEYAAERRRRERETLNREVQALRDDPHRLTESERQMIDSIGLRRVQANERSQNTTPPTPPISTNYSPTLIRQASDHQVSTNLPSSPPIFHLQGRSTASISEYMRQRNLERSRPNERSFQPRRRTSVVISNSNSTGTSSPHTSSLAPIGSAAPTLSVSPSRLASSVAADTTENIPSSFSLINSPDPWQAISTAMGTNSEAMARITRMRRDANAAAVRSVERRLQSPNASNASEQQQTLQHLAARNERQRGSNAINVQRLRQMQAAIGGGEVDYEYLGFTRRLQPEEVEPVIMGLGWGEDGRILLVATEAGILEYTVNLEERRQFPSRSLL